MDITVSLQIKITFDGNKKVSVGKLEQKVTEAVIERVDEELIEKYCGGKYARGNSKKRYQRAGSVERHPVTSVGKIISGCTGLGIKRKRRFSCPWKIE